MTTKLACRNSVVSGRVCLIKLKSNCMQINKNRANRNILDYVYKHLFTLS